jgi:2-keto-3-deoxy-L-rhamnonate aldolase RhmA
LSGSSFVAEAMATQALDWMLVDMEASHASKEDLLHVLQAITAYDVTPLVRVQDQTKHHIESSLDFGARGVMIPKVDTQAQAIAMSAACYYPPKGTRGVNCIRASAYYTRAKEYLENANESVLSVMQVESSESVDNVFGIASVPNVGALFLGPGDLAASYGQMGVVTGGRMDEARRRVVTACQEYGKISGIFAHSVESANQYIGEGFLMVALGNDIKHVNSGLAQALGGVRLTRPPRRGVENQQESGYHSRDKKEQNDVR